MKTILVVLNMGVPSGAQKFAGVRRFIAEEYNWEIIPVRTNWDFRPEILENAVARGIDGVLYSMEESKEGVALLARMTIPTVVIDSPRGDLGKRTRNIAFFATDNAAIAREAAEAFLKQGIFRSYACAVNDVESHWAKARAAAFREHLKKQGIDNCTIIPGDTRDAEVREILFALPKPCALFAVNDDRALEMLHVCRRAGLAVPSDVAILGVDNDEAVCLNTQPHLSSIEVDFEGAGYKAARMLDAMIGPTREARSTRHEASFGVRRVLVRGSMMKESAAGKLVQRAVAYINHHATEGIGVRDVIAHLRISRSLADRYFRRLQNTSINEAIVARKLEILKERLLSSDKTIDEVAAECGFANPTRPKVLFRQRFGLSMREWRLQERS